MKINCFIDTCSCIHLSNTHFFQKTLLEHLSERAVLNYSNEVYKELGDHKKQGDKNLPAFIVDKKKKLSPQKFKIDDYEQKFVDRVLISRKKYEDKGEIDNFIVSVDQIHYTKSSSLIFITDDKAALNGVMSEWFETFPAVKLWTSYEVILFLYADNIIPSSDIAINLLQQMTHFLSPKKDISDKTTQKFLSLKSNYINRINRIRKFLK